MSSISLGKARADAATALSRHRKIFGLALGLQGAIGLVFLLFPTFSLGVVGLSPLMGPEWPSIWGAMLIFVSLLQIPGAIDPVNQRYTNVIAVFGRLLMVVTFLCHGGQFWVFAAFDFVVGAFIFASFRRLVIAELQTRP
jgi:hypothetical protein